MYIYILVSTIALFKLLYLCLSTIYYNKYSYDSYTKFDDIDDPELDNDDDLNSENTDNINDTLINDVIKLLDKLEENSNNIPQTPSVKISSEKDENIDIKNLYERVNILENLVVKLTYDYFDLVKNDNVNKTTNNDMNKTPNNENVNEISNNDMNEISNNENVNETPNNDLNKTSNNENVNEISNNEIKEEIKEEM
jgi:hypothetical protein